MALAAVNGPLATVLSGEPAAIAELVQAIEARGGFARQLRVDFASHCGQMDPLVPELVTLLDGIAPAAPAVPIYSTVTGRAADGWEFDASYWGRNARQPVLFADAFDGLLNAGVDIVLEIGPHPVLAGAMADCARQRNLSPALLASLRRDQPERASMLGSAGALHTLGCELAWARILPAGGRSVSLPPYPWQRERHWLGPVRRPAVAPAGVSSNEDAGPAAGEDVAHWFYDVAWKPLAEIEAGRSAAWMPMPLALNRASSSATESGGRSTRIPSAPIERFRDLASAYAAAAMRGAGLSAGERFTPPALAARLGVVDGQRRMFDRVLEILEARGVFERRGEDRIVLTVPPVQDAGAIGAAIRSQAPAYEAELTLLERCGSRLADVLRGECDPLDLLFPGGSLADAERLYEQSTFSRRHNEHIRAMLQALVERKPADRRLRVLEIGAGTGATTRYALEALPDGSVEYVFTDASPMFLARAREKFRHRSDVEYTPLDIEQDPIGQGLTAGSFDVVIAANVLHATRDLRRTLGHASRLLADDGLLMLLEGVKPEPWVDLIFGLTSGWWKFDDLALRPAYPLLTGDSWITTLAEAGFAAADVWLDPMGESLFTQAVILARAPAAQARPGGRTREWLVLAGSDGAGDRFAAARRDAGDRAVVVAREAAPTQAAVHALVQEGWTAPALDRHVIDFRGLDVSAATSVDQAALDVCAETLVVAQRLASMGAGAPRLWIVTRGAERVGAGDQIAVDQAPVWGLARVLALEHPQVWGGIVDVDGGSSAAIARGLSAIVDRAGAEDQMALRGDAAYVARLVSSPIEAGSPLQLRPDATYLVTGGLGNLGLKAARWMVARGARHLVLAGRRARNESAVRELEAAGATARVVHGDVSDAAWVSALIADLAAGDFPLKGILHAAGVSVRKPLVELDRKAFESDFAPKVNGAWLLHQATAGSISISSSCSRRPRPSGPRATWRRTRRRITSSTRSRSTAAASDFRHSA